MKTQEFTNSGQNERTLTDAEVVSLAAQGNREAKIEVVKRAWATMTAAQKIEAILNVI